MPQAPNQSPDATGDEARSRRGALEIARDALGVGAAVLTLFLSTAVVVDVYWQKLLPFAGLVLLFALWTTRTRLGIVRRDPGITRSDLEQLDHMATAEMWTVALLFGVGAALYLEGPANELLALFLLPLLPFAFWSSHISGVILTGRSLTLREEIGSPLPAPWLRVALVISLFAIAGTGWAVGAESVGYPGPHELLALFRGGTEAPEPPEPPPPPSRSPGGRAPEPSVLPSIISSPPPPPSPSPTVSPPSSCWLATFEVLHSPKKKLVGRAMWDAWRYHGDDVIGCATSGVAPVHGIFTAVLEGGESDPSWVVSDDIGRAQVVFQQLVPRAEELRGRGVLEHVGPRTGTGYGDYQIFFLEDSRCVLFGRGVYDSAYFRLPPAAVRLASDEGVERGMFPSLMSSETVRGYRRISVKFQAPTGTDETDPRDTLVVDGLGNAWFASEPQVRVPPTATCPDPSGLRYLAKQLLARYLRDH